jgi:hypothetical protein
LPGLPRLGDYRRKARAAAPAAREFQPMSAPAFAQAGVIEDSLELLAERCADPTPLVYERLFAANALIKGEMLSRVFTAILDFVGERRYAGMMIGAEMITHEGYDVPREVFATFFAVVRDVAREVLGLDSRDRCRLARHAE